jgi:hypothetical protein
MKLRNREIGSSINDNGKRSSEAQDVKAIRKIKKKEKEIKMDIWLRLPVEIIWEILSFVVAFSPVLGHKDCFNSCTESSFESKLAMKEHYESHWINEWTFYEIESALGCPIWGIGHLDQVSVDIVLRHCECTLGSALHATVNKPSKVTIGQLTLIDKGVDLESHRKMVLGAKIVVKDFGMAKHQKIEQEDDDVDDQGDVKVCYHDKS